jgi:hypothetical protein
MLDQQTETIRIQNSNIITILTMLVQQTETIQIENGNIVTILTMLVQQTETILTKKLQYHYDFKDTGSTK